MKKNQDPYHVEVGLVGGVSLARLDHDLESILQECEGLDEDQEAKHVYSCFGLAMYHAQDLEGDLKIVLAAYARAIGGVGPEEIDAYSDGFARNTLGQLISRIRCNIQVNPKAEQVIRIALRKRNFIAHEFFIRRNDYMFHTKGRRALCTELLRTAQLFRFAGHAFEPLIQVLLSQLGWPPERIERLMKDREDRAKAKFGAQEMTDNHAYD